MKIEGPLWIESKPEEGEFSGSTIYIQFISFNDKEMDYENPHHTAKVMSAMLTPNDVETIGDKDPSSLFLHRCHYSLGNNPRLFTGKHSSAEGVWRRHSSR